MRGQVPIWLPPALLPWHQRPRLQNGLGKLDIPVAKIIPNKLINPICGIVEPISFNGLRDCVLRLHRFTDNPARQRRAGLGRVEIIGRETAIHFAETCSVPSFVPKLR